MKKKTLVSAVLAATIMGTTSVSLAAENMFSDVPLDHWAYDAIAKLAEDGIIEGYGDTGFGGDKAITRYEMAQLVAKAQANQENARAVDKAAIEKLQQEFDSELKGEVQDLKKDVADLKSRMSWYGDARVRYLFNKKMNGHDNDNGGRRTQFEERVRLGFWAQIDDNLSVDGRMKLENTVDEDDGWGQARQNFNQYNTADSVYRDQGKFGIDRLSLTWDKGDTKYRIGRNETSLGQGLLWWENPIDGVEVEHKFGDKVTAKVGYGDTAAGGWYQSNLWTLYGDVKVQTSPATSITLAALHNTTNLSYYGSQNTESTIYRPSDGSHIGSVWIDSNGDGVDEEYKVWGNEDGVGVLPTETYSWQDSNYKMNQIALGFNTQLAPKWNWTVEGVTNNVAGMNGEAVNKHGVWSRLKYGNLEWGKANTWHVYGEYFALGNASMDTIGWGHHLNIQGGNASPTSWGDGARGWGIGVGYQLARNTNLELTYYMLKPYDKEAATFDKYQNVGYAALSYSF